ncbi:MAG: secretion protein F, partial [Oscillospiraceae bacterium]
LSVVRKEKKAAKSVETYLLGFAVKLSKFIRMDEFKRIRMKNVLDAAGLAMTPEVYGAYAFVKSGAILLGIIPCLLVFPLLSPLLVFLAIMVYFKETKRADEQLKAKRDQIERELPRFVATVEQELKASRDVLSILERFKGSSSAGYASNHPLRGAKKHAGESFAAELDIVTADMRSSSYEAALTRFEARLNSPMLSDVVRGLIGVLRGDDGGMYFQMLAHDMKQLELQRLKAEALKIPPKIRVFSFVMLMCFLFTYLA